MKMTANPNVDKGFSRTASPWVAVAVAALAMCVMPGCRKAAQPAPVLTVQAQKPEQGVLSEQITADAILTPVAQAAIVPRLSAPVQHFYVQRGSKVHMGQLLATLENADLAAGAEENKGAYMAAQAAYATATRAQVPEEMQKAELDLAQAKANLSLNQSIVRSRRQLFTQGAIPGRDLDTAEAALVQAQAAYDTAAKHLKAVKAVSQRAALKAAQGQLTAAQGKYKGAAAQLGYSEIRSPINGIVTDRPLFAGETATAGTTLLTVMDTTVLLAKAHIGQTLAQQMKAGDKASVLVPGIDKPVPARVSLVSPALDPGSTTVEVWLRIDNRKGVLKVGTPVQVSITGRTVANAWKIPLSAVLTTKDGAKSVMVIAPDGTAHRKQVALGIVDGDQVQILSGVDPNDMVITVGSYGLDEGSRVKAGSAGDEQSTPEDAAGGEGD